MLALGINSRLEKFHVADARDLHRILERKEQAFACTLFGFHFQQVVPLEGHAAGCGFVTGPAGKHVAHSALARTVGPHDGVNFARFDLDGQPFKDILLFNFRVQVFDI